MNTPHDQAFAQYKRAYLAAGNLAFLYREPMRTSDPECSFSDAMQRGRMLQRRYPHLTAKECCDAARIGQAAERRALQQAGDRLNWTHSRWEGDQ